MKKILQIACIVIAGVGTQALLYADDSPQHQRWAIISAKTLTESALPELLTAELSGVENLELVERDELLAATREMEISILHGSQAARKRLELGQLLNADALVLLSLQEQQEKVFLQIVICDCLTGARLNKEYFPYDTSKLEISAKQCKVTVLKTRQRFAKGVRKLIGITPFLSKNLTHEHDNLQTGLPALIENSLGNYPGVAVIELEEAKSIAQELRLTGGELKHKFVMLFVDGEYQVTATTENQPSVMRLVVRINDGKKIRIPIDRDELPMDEATELLRQQVADEIAGLTESERIQPFARALQYEQLAARADMFSQAGSWRPATSLREAALLLKKPDLEQRLALIADYRRWQFADHEQQSQAMFRFIQSNWKNMSPELAERNWRDVFDERLSRLRLIALHTALAIRSGDLNPHEADVLAAACYRDPLLLKLSGENARQDYRDALYDFFWDIYPLIPQLDATQNGGKIRPQVAHVDPYRQPRSSMIGIGSTQSVYDRSRLESFQREQWTQNALDFLTRVAPLQTELTKSPNVAGDTWDDRRTLDELYRFLTEVVPPDQPLFAMSLITMNEEMFSAIPFVGMVRQHRFTPEQMHQFCQRLEQSESRANQLYGRCGNLALRIRATGKPLDDAVLREANIVLEQIADQRKESGNDRYATGFDTSIIKLRGYAEKRLAGPNEKRHALTPNIIPAVDPAPRITFAPVDGILPEWEHLTKCSDSLDLMWSKQAVFSMSEPGKVVKLFSATEPRDEISSVVWDGESVWIGALRSGLRVVSPDGKLLSEVGTEQGLPPFDDSAKQEDFSRASKRALLLHPLGSSKCLAIGRFGSRNRVWFAVISQTEPSDDSVNFQARVFHTATKIGDKSAGVDAIFNLNSLAEIPDWRDPQHRLLLVGRGIPEGWPAIMRPLAIDLSTLKTSVFPGVIPMPAHASMHGRQAFHASQHKIMCYSAPASKDEIWLERTLANFSMEPGMYWFVPQLLAYEGKLCNPGVIWRRIDPQADISSIDQIEIEQINEVPLPLRNRYQHYGVSAHYGLIGWNNYDRYYRVRFDQQPAQEPDLAMLYPEIPANAREKHHDAVQEIRKLGGYVDASWGTAAWGLSISERSAVWFTRVHLPKNWQGGDEGLRYLRDLHNLRSLMLVQANVSNQGLEESIGKLLDLQALQLVETAVTNDGLVYLQGLPQLTHLRLEGTIGGDQFDDEGLKAVARYPRLAHLEIYGPGFTAAGLETVNSLRKPFTQLISTQVTKTQLVDLREKYPGLRASVIE